MAQCLVCDAHVTPFMSFGKMPIANGFQQAEDLSHELFQELEVGFCAQCRMVQLLQLIDPKQLFHENYAYFSSISVHMAAHFHEFAEQVRKDYLGATSPFVIEIGSNDGIMLQHFAQRKIRHLGVEPSANVAQAAKQQGVNTLCQFFDHKTASDILEDYGPADAILGANVICHIPGIHSLVQGVSILLKEKGVFIFEEPYLGDIIEKTAYDQIYDEHVFYFSISSLSNLFVQYNMEIVNVLPQNVHGGSMRYIVARKGSIPVMPIVGDLKAREAQLGLTQESTFHRFRKQVVQSRDQLSKLLKGLKEEGKTIVGYGATSKSTIVTNFCKIGPNLLDYISDTTPTKQGKYSPGVHIPVVPYERFSENYPDYALLFAWNHAEEIIEKEQAFLDQGGKFITFVPSVRVLD